MIIVPLWLAGAVTGWAGIATLLWVRRVLLAERLVDRRLDAELAHPDPDEVFGRLDANDHPCGDPECEFPAWECPLIHDEAQGRHAAREWP